MISANVSCRGSQFAGDGLAITCSAEVGITVPLSKTTPRAVVLLHGASQESAVLELGLRKHGFHVATPSVRGLHDRDQPSFSRWTSDALAEFDHLAATCAEINVCGVSRGAATALAVAAERPTKLDCLALICPRLGLSVRTISRWRLLVPTPKWPTDWCVFRRRQRSRTRVRPEDSGDLPICGNEDRPLFAAGSDTSWAQLREDRLLVRGIKDSLEQIRTPTLIVGTCEDPATIADIRYVQVHIGSQFLEVFIATDNRLSPHGAISERMVLKVVEFFNDVARRRALAAMCRS